MKRWEWILFICLLFSTVAEASFFGSLKDAASTGNLITGLIVLVIAWIFKAIPNAKIYAFVEAFGNKLGIIMTLGLSKCKVTAGIWNKTIEPWVIDFVDNTVSAFIAGWIKGAKSDNG